MAKQKRYPKKSKKRFSFWNKLSSKSKLGVIFAVIFALVGGYYIFTSFAASAVGQTEAESLVGNGTVVTDLLTSGTHALKLTTNTPATGSLTTTAPGTNVIIHAKGTQCNGAPQAQVKIDGAQVLLASVSGTTWGDYTVTVTVAQGTHTLSAAFTNPYSYTGHGKNGKGSCVRELYLDYIQVQGNNIPPPPPTDTTLPVASITSPVNGSTVSGTVRIAATATDNSGVVTKVEFYIDNVLRSTVNASPYNYTWDTTAASNGAHTAKVIAYDAANNAGNSTVITVTVNNPAIIGAPVFNCNVTVSTASQLRTEVGTANRGVVCLAPGEYDVTSYIPVASGVTVQGPATIKYTPTTCSDCSHGLLESDGKNNITINNLTLDGNTSTTSGMGAGFRAKNHSHHIKVEYVTVINTGSSGIDFQVSDYAVAVHNTLHHIGYFQAWSSAINVWYGGAGSTSWWYDTNAGFHVIVAYNNIWDVADNSSAGTDGNGIIIDGGGNLYPVLMYGNLIHDVRGRGISTLSNTSDFWAINNTVVNAGASGYKNSNCGYPSYMTQNGARAHWINDISAPGCGPNYDASGTGNINIWKTDIDSNTKNGSLTPDSNVKIASPGLDSNYVPQSGSPALGTGTNPSTVLTGANLTTATPYLPVSSTFNIGAR